MTIYSTIILEFLLISISILLLFRLRSHLGLAPLYILLGSIQYLQANLGGIVSFDIFSSYPIYPGSVILFSSILFAVLLIYIKEGVTSARALIVGIIISNFIITGLFEITYAQEFIIRKSENIDINTISVFKINYGIFIIGTLVLLLDFFLLVIVYQFLISKIKKNYFFIVLMLSLFTVLMFDSLVFNVTLFYNNPDFTSTLMGHFIGKSIAAILFSTILFGYLKFVDQEIGKTSFITNQKRDIFSILSYRKKIKFLETEKKEIEEKLTSRIETTLNKISDGFVSLDTYWCYTYVNEKAAELLGRTPSNLIGKHIWTEFPDDVGLPYYNVYYKAFETQKTLYFIDYNEHMDRWLEYRVYPSPEGLTIYFTDITDQRKADEKNQTLLSLVETSDDFIGLSTLEGKPFYLNSPGKKLIGLEEHDSLPESISDFFPEAYRSVILNEHMPTIMQKESWSGEAEFQHLKTGNKIPIEMSGFLIRDRITNQPIALGNVATDITKRKQIEEKIVASEKLFRRLTSNAPAAIFQSDQEGSCNYVNEEWIKYSGISFNEAMGFGWSKSLHPEDKERVLTEWHQAVFSENEFVSEFKIQHKNGSFTWVSGKAVGLYDTQDNLYGYLGILLDITDRKKSELALKESENHIKTILETEPECIKQLSADGTLLYMNPAGLAMIEADNLDMVKGKSVKNLVVSEHQYAFKKLINQIFKGQSGHLEFEIIGLKGTKRWLESHAVPLKNNEGKIISFLSVTRDITESKKAETALIKSKKYLDNIINNIGDPVFVKDDQSRFLLVNESFCSVLNLTKEFIIGKTLAENIPDDEIEGFLSNDKQVLSTGIENVTEEDLTIMGQETRIISTKKTRYIDDDGHKFLIGTIRDITENKKAQEQISISEKYLESIINNIGDPVFVKDDESRMLLVNDALCSLFGLPRAEIIGKTLAEKVPYDERESFLRIDKQVILNGIENVNEETLSFNNKDIRTISTKKTRYIDSSGKIFLIGVIRDTTEQKKAEREILALGNRNTLIIETLLDGFLLADTTGKILDVNPSYVNMIGFTPEELLTMNINQLEFELDQKEIDERMKEMVSTGFARFHSNHKKKSGEIINLDVNIFAMLINEQHVVAAFMKDITEQKKAEIAIKESEEKFSKAFESNVIGKAILNNAKTIIEVNEALANIVGFKRENMLGKTAKEIGLFNFDNEKNLENENKLWSELSKNGYVSNMELKYLMNTGIELFILISLQTLQLNNEAHVIITVLDITEKKNAEEELEHHKNNLEELVKTRTEEVDSKNAELNRMNKLFVGRELKMIELKNIIKELQLKKDD